MKLNPFHAMVVAALLAAGCAQPTSLLLPQAGQTVTQGASLHLSLDLGRRTQVLVDEVKRLEVSLELPGQAPIVRTFEQGEWHSDSLDVSGLPSGNAMVKVRAFDANQGQLGDGSSLVALLIGRRTYAQIVIRLSSEGRTDLLPLAPLKPGTYSVEPTTGQTPDPGWTPPPSPTYKAGDYFIPSTTLAGRTYDVSEDMTDDYGLHQRTATMSERIVSDGLGTQVVRSEDWTFKDGGTSHRDATDSFRVLNDGSVVRDTIQTLEGPGMATSSFFIPAQALTMEGVPLPPDGKIWLEGTDVPISTPTSYYSCMQVHEHRGPIGAGVDTIYWVSQGVGVVRMTRQGNVKRPDGTVVNVNYSMTLSGVEYVTRDTAYRVRR